MTLVSKVEFAKVIGVTPGRVTQLVTEGMPAAGPKIPLVAAAVWYRENITTSKGGPPSASASLVAERKRQIAALAALAELNLAIRRGEVAEVSEIAEKWASIASLIRNRLLLLPARAAVKVAPDNPGTAQAILQEEINAALTELSRGGESVKKKKKGKK